jgi:NADH dehydrogenase (ubiquinone) 1 alpha subcomplex subunit 5
MRAAARLLASVRQGKYLEPGTPTGLTGLLTHPSPRSTLLYHYTATLDKLQQIPESSVYRQATEALTKHRLKIIEEAIPAGWTQWQQTVQDKVHEDPTAFQSTTTSQGTVVQPPKFQELDPRTLESEWDGEPHVNFPPGMRTEAQRAPHVKAFKGDVNYMPERTMSPIKLPPEPQYTVEA